VVSEMKEPLRFIFPPELINMPPAINCRYRITKLSDTFLRCPKCNCKFWMIKSTIENVLRIPRGNRFFLRPVEHACFDCGYEALKLGERKKPGAKK